MNPAEPSPGTARIALVGDFRADVLAHQAIPLALARARDDARTSIDWTWVGTTTLTRDADATLADFHGVWCVPASPYASTAGALAAIGFARRTNRPFLGTCGGFQHALLEYARDVWRLPEAAHAELDPDAGDPLVARLSCGLVEVVGEIHAVPGSRLAGLYGDALLVHERYHCNYGLSPRHAWRLADGPLRVAARDASGEVRAIELDGHPFFLATLFQPERAALADRSHPLVNAFVRAVASRARR